MKTDRAELLRLLGAAHDAARGPMLARLDARELLAEAVAYAPRRIPGPLGVAVATVLAIAEHERRNTGLPGILGMAEPTLFLAAAVVALPEPEGA